MKFDVTKIAKEWAYRSKTGMPDTTTYEDIETLQEVLVDLKYPGDFIFEYIGCLLIEKDRSDDARLADKDVVYKSEDGKTRTIKYSSALTYDTDHPARIAAEKMKNGDSAQDKEGESPEKLSGDDFKTAADKEVDKDASDTIKKGKVTGDSSEGDNQVKNDMLKYGYSGYEKNTGSKPAPGGAGSAFNEIISGEGVHVLRKNPNMTDEELAMKMYEMTEDTPLGKEQKKTTGLGKLPDVANKDLYTKCLVSAKSARKKYERTEQRVSTLQEQGKMGKVDKIDTYYGADKSLEAQVESITTANKVFIPGGTEVTKEDAIAFTKAGGGGQNPSDTATFVKDNNGNLLLQFHSDKTTTSDIQDNSTLAQEGENYKSSIDTIDGLSPEQKEEAKAIIDDYSTKINNIEENYNDQATPIAQKLQELPIDIQIDIIQNDKGTLNKNIDQALFGAKGLKPQYEKYLDGADPNNLDLQQKYKIIRKHVASGNGKSNDTKVVNKVGLALQKIDSNIEGIDVKKNLSQQRQKAVELQRQRVDKLNERTVNIDGVDIGIGTLMEADETVRGFHLSLMDYPPKGYEKGNPGSMIGSALDVNMGGTIVDGGVLRKCLGVNNTKEFKQKFSLVDEEKLTKDTQGNITGKVVYTYAIDAGGKKIEVGYKTYRSKAGATGKTSNTMQYSKHMQNCFKGGDK